MAKKLGLETHSIDFIPLNQRHGKASDLFFLWFGANAQMAVVTTGILTIVPHFGFIWAALGIVIGSLLGSIFMASHSAQGPHLGIPQMIQSRAQFGYYGAVIPLFMVVAMYLGFYAAGAVIGAEALALLFHIPIYMGILISSAADLLLVIGGYQFIHRFNHMMAYFFSLVFLGVSFLLIWGPGLGRGLNHATFYGHFMVGPFLLSISLAVINTLGYAPYVADYSRYLPEKTTIKSTFWYSYVGVGISNIWMMILGAAVQAQSPHSDPMIGFFHLGSKAFPLFGLFVLLAAWLGVVSINALNIYGTFMSTLTIVTTFYRRWNPTFRLRLWFIVPIAVVATYVSFFDKSHLLMSFETFLTFLIDFLVPWTAINLTDFYVVRRGDYNIRAIFNPNGSYGRINTTAMVCYFGGFLAELPFMNNSVYEGPIARILGNGDISWMVGLLVAGSLYWLLEKRGTANLGETENMSYDSACNSDGAIQQKGARRR
ncbi:MAG: cytosine permease [Firmicutes bacterium]|nr:cytosine permease [Bacillota bacterium]MCL5013188.1 cytosine permease [Bacillota bacterium]